MSEWIRQDVRHLRIIPQNLWDAAKARQKALDKSKSGLHRNNRPQYLLSNLLKCGECGDGYSKINSERYGCSSARNKGDSICANKKTIKREHIEGLVLNALQAQKNQQEKLVRSEHFKLVKECENLVSAIRQGV